VINFRCFAALSALVVAACATHTDIKSVKSPTYARMPQRILFLANTGSAFEFWGRSQQLGNMIEESLKGCGLAAAFQSSATLTLGDPIANRIRDFSPDAIVSINWRSERVSNGGVEGITYSLELMDVPTKSVVWKAEMNQSSPISVAGADDTIPSFAIALIERLRTDGLVPASCQVAKTT
jgi:hypothetical protein